MAAVPSIGRASLVEAPGVAPQAAATHGLYERHASKIQSYCHHQLGSREEAEDAVQTTFMNAFRALGRGVVPEAESAWLFKIAENVCLSRRRSSWRRGRIESPSDFDVIEQIVPGPSVQRDELIGIEDALASMPEQQRRAILLREWQGLSYREIAAELEVSQSAVETLIFRARRSLAQGLEQPDSIKPAKRKSFRRAVRIIDFGTIVAAAKTLLAGSAAVKATATAVVVTAAAGTAATVAPKVETMKPAAQAPAVALVAHAPAKPSTSAASRASSGSSLSFVSSTAGSAASVEKPRAFVVPRPANLRATRLAVSRPTAAPARVLPDADALAPTAPLAAEPQPATAAPVQQPAPAPAPAVEQPKQEQPKHEQRRLESATPAAEPKRNDEGKNQGTQGEGKQDEGKKDKTASDRGGHKHTGPSVTAPPAPAPAPVAEPVVATPAGSPSRERAGYSDRRDNDEHAQDTVATEAPAPVTAPAPAPVVDSKNDRQRRNERRDPAAAAPAAPVLVPVVAPTEPVVPAVLAPAAQPDAAPAPERRAEQSDRGSRSGIGRRKDR